MSNPLDGSQGNIPYNGDNYSDNPWQQFQNNWLFHQSDNYVNGGLLSQGLNPGEAQYSEWSQQMVSTMYQNWYNSAPEQMKRALAAGINPFVAASGIAGNGIGSIAPAPNASNTSSLPNLIGSAAQGLSSIGSSFGSVVSGIATLAKLRHEIKNLDQNTASEFEKMGFTHLQSVALSTQLKYLDSKEQVSIWQALANFDKTKQEYQNLAAQHNNIIAQYDEIVAHKDLLIQEQGEVAARKLVNEAMESKLKAEADWQNTQNEFFQQHGYVLGSPIYESLRDMAVTNGTFDMDSFGSTVAGYQGRITSAVEHAKAEESWNYRPSNAAEAAAYIGATIGNGLRDLILDNAGVSNWSQFASKLSANASANREFNQAFRDAKEDLYEDYLSKKRYYRNLRRGGNPQAVGVAKNKMERAKEEYDNFTKENFYNELVKKLSPRD